MNPDPVSTPPGLGSMIAPSGTQPRQTDLFRTPPVPVLVAWGAGVPPRCSSNSLKAAIPPTQFCSRTLGGEHPVTYQFIPIFMAWLQERGVPCQIVRYELKDFKNFPPYRTLPSKAFGFGSCSSKWKVQPQNRWAENWAPARAIWAAGGKVIKLIGYNCSPADQARYAEREGYEDPRYDIRYPLREWGWDRAACEAHRGGRLVGSSEIGLLLLSGDQTPRTAHHGSCATAAYRSHGSACKTPIVNR
jgi:hypothetical protein